MEFETLVIVTGLADDHEGVREALTAAAKLALGPAAVVIDSVVPPELGFDLVVATPEPVTPAALANLREALAAELHEREVMHAELAVELVDAAES